MLDYKISSAIPEDKQAISELLNLPGIRFGTFVNPFRTEAFVDRSFGHAPDGSLNLVARTADGLIGQAILAVGPGRRRHTGTVFVAVHDSYRGHGIGSSLLGSIIEYSERWLDLSRMELFVFADNIAAIALYLKMGFAQEGLHKAYAFRDSQKVDCISMARLRNVGSDA